MEEKVNILQVIVMEFLKNIRDKVICLNKQQIKDAVTCLHFNCYFTVETKIFCQIIGIAMGSVQFLPIYSYIFMKVSG